MKKSIHHRKRNKRLYLFCWFLFIVYIVYSVYLLFYGFYRSDGMIRNYPVNLVPFSTILQYIEGKDHFNFNTWFNNLFGNVLLFMPFGFLLPYLIKRLNNIVIIAVCSFVFSCAIEVTQRLNRVGSFDVDDIILNTAGGIVGYLLFISCKMVLRIFRPLRINNKQA